MPASRHNPDSALRNQQITGLHILTSETSIHVSREREGDGGEAVMGHFTRRLVEGPESGKADDDTDGNVTVSDLRKYLGRTMQGQEPRYFALPWRCQGSRNVALIVGATRALGKSPYGIPLDVSRILV